MKTPAWIIRQFFKPTGLLGRVAGWIMLHRPGNKKRIAWTVENLGLEPHHSVLEIGCGPGLGLQLAAERAQRIVGLDHSAVMIQMARRRNPDAVECLCGTLQELDTDVYFDRIFAVNVAQFWKHPAEELKLIFHLLKPGGRVSLTLQPRVARDKRAAAEKWLHEVSDALQSVGFAMIHTDSVSGADETPVVNISAEKQ